MNSLRWRMAGWFTLSLLAVLGGFIGVTYLHLQHELRIERWEREHPEHPDWTLHGSYSKSEVDDIAGELWRLSLLYSVPVALLTAGLGYLLASRSLDPLAEMNRQLRSIGAGSLSHRVRLTRADREFQAIEANINALLARLEGAFRQLTEYSAQVAHELRAPLTLLRLQIEDAADRIEPALAESLQDELGRLSDYVDQCLLLATAEQGRLVLKPEHVPLRPLLVDLLETYELWARSQQREVRLAAGPDVTVTADSRYLRQILHILLSNAIRHGSGPIDVLLEPRADHVACRIENRVSNAPGAGTGSGLGLRVAQAVATAQGCILEAFAAPPGFVAKIRWFPARAPRSPGKPPAPVTSRAVS
jgi:signal transduction histidine kinase